MGVLREGLLSIPKSMAPGAKRDSRAWIIKILSKEWPLAAKDIYFRIQRESGGSITYQGIHKSIRQLASEDVLQRVHSKYSLNPDWVAGLSKFGDELQEAFRGKRCVHLGEVAGNSTVQLVFDSFIDYFYWLIEELGKRAAENNGEGISTYSISYHPWPILNLSKSQFIGLKALFSSGNHYIACRSNLAFDKSLISLWRMAGAKVRLGAECSRNCDMIAFDDYVVQIFLSQATKRKLGRIFSASQRRNGNLLSDFYRVIYGVSEPVTVLVSRNLELAFEVKGEVVKEFT
ncbi:MAG: hypothetical protein ABH863_02510 [Candidatus Micrarchaeota archaeon]